MDALHHKRFDCFAVYDKNFFRQDESGGFEGEIEEICMKAAALGQKMDKFWIF